MQREKQKKIKNENKNKTVASNLNYNFLFKSFFHPSFQEGRKALGAKPIIRTPKSLIFFFNHILRGNRIQDGRYIYINIDSR